MIIMRGHHLICLHFFRGEGYSPEFIGNLRGILQRAETGEPIKVISGADDICNVCPHLRGDNCFYANDSAQEIRGMDGKALELLARRVSDITLWPAIREKIPGIFHRWSEKFCKACDWRKACEKNAFFSQLLNEKTVR